MPMNAVPTAVTRSTTLRVKLSSGSAVPTVDDQVQPMEAGCNQLVTRRLGIQVARELVLDEIRHRADSG